MRRAVVVVLAFALAAPGAGCQRTVEVRTGVRVECPYGHVDESGVQTLRVAARAASSYRVETERRVCDRHERLEALYRDAQRALASQDTTTALEKLRLIADEEPGFRRASSQLAALEKGERPAPDEGAGTPSRPAPSTPKPGESATEAPAGSLARYTPDSLPGFRARAPLVEAFSVTREYDPLDVPDARLLTIVADQFRTSAEAKAALERHLASYPKASATERAGRRTVRFGSDGRRFITAAFTQGAVLVVLELGSRPGVDPRALKGALIGAAARLP